MVGDAFLFHYLSLAIGDSPPDYGAEALLVVCGVVVHGALLAVGVDKRSLTLYFWQISGYLIRSKLYRIPIEVNGW
ncbi:hypothetical protein evm_000681 [Chilo suppressalis]|nr:hypothetical protein evm_000681 [Chilo suppressalis]